MFLAVHNVLSGERDTLELPAHAVWVGRAGSGGDAPFAALRSAFVSRQHVCLHPEEDGWSIEHAGLNETRLAGDTLLAGRRYAFEIGEELRIAEFILSLVTAPDDVPQADTGVLEREHSRFEAAIHDALLEQMNLRKTESPVDLASAETRSHIEDRLDKLIAHAIAEAAPELLEHILSDHVLKRLTWRITMAGVGFEPLIPRSGEDAIFEKQIGEILDRASLRLGLHLTRDTAQRDLALLESDFSKVWADHRLECSQGLRDYVVHSATQRQILDVIYGLGPLQDLIEMDCVSEIMVVARDQIFIEKFGMIEDAKRAFYSDELLLSTIERIVAPLGRRIDQSSPMVDAHLSDGSRVNAVIPPVSFKGPCVTIRKFARQALGVEDLVRAGALDQRMAAFLAACVRCGTNTIVSGGTGSGKTTMLNCLSQFIPEKERIVTIEDTVELQLIQSHVVVLEARPANMEGKGEISIRDLVKNALRMRPDRVIVGECRGPEALDMLQAMNTGHDGSMATAHANTPEDVVRRLETMVLTGAAMPVAAIREQIASALELVVQLRRFPDGARRITHVSEVTKIDDETGRVILEDIFVFHPSPDGGRHLHTGYVPTFVERLIQRGDISLRELFGGEIST